MKKRQWVATSLLGVAALLAGGAPAWALEINANKDLDTALNTWVNLVGTADTIVPNVGVYNWADKNGDGGMVPASAGLIMNGYKAYTDNGSSFKLDLNGGSITNGGDLTTYTASAASGNITLTNAGSISIGLLSTETALQKQPGAIRVTQSGAFQATRVNTHGSAEGAGAAQSFAGNNTGSFTLTGTGTSMNSTHTPEYSVGNPAGAISIRDYTGVDIAGVIDSSAGQGNGGNVDIGASGNNIGGNVTIGKITTSVSGGANGGKVKLYADGAIVVGDIVTGANTPTTYATPATGANDVNVVGKSLTAGAIQAWSRREGFNPGKIELTGTDGSGACTVSSLSTERSCYAGVYYAATITISNFSAITVNGDVRADIVTSDGSANGGAITMSSGAGGIDIKGALSAKAYSTGTKGPMSLTSSGREITLSSLNLSNVQYAVVSPGWKCIVKGDLVGFSTNVESQTQLRMPVGKRMIYYPGLTNNAYLAGGKYALASPGGTPAAGGVLMPYASPGLVVTLK